MLKKTRAFLRSGWLAVRGRISRIRSTKMQPGGLAHRFKQFPMTTTLMLAGPAVLLALVVIVAKFGFSLFASAKLGSILGHATWRYIGWALLLIAIILLLSQSGWLRKQAGSLGSNAGKILKDDWRRDGIAFLVAFGLAHFLAYHYFEEWYRPFFLDSEHHAIWWLQAFLIVWFLIKDEVKKHKIINFFAKAAIAITIVATLAEAGMTGHGMYNARIVASAKFRDSVAKINLKSLQSAVFIPPVTLDTTCTRYGVPFDTLFDIQVSPSERKVIIPPVGCRVQDATYDAKAIYILTRKREATDPRYASVDTIVPGKVNRSIVNARWIGFDTFDQPVRIQIHIFPRHQQRGTRSSN